MGGGSRDPATTRLRALTWRPAAARWKNGSSRASMTYFSRGSDDDDDD
jgi:hypothetical protein